MLIPSQKCQHRGQKCLVGTSEYSTSTAHNERWVGLSRTLRTIRHGCAEKTQQDRCGLFTTRRCLERRAPECAIMRRRMILGAKES
jgi:hypothetical protein